ncbi:uncharacterized protein LOC141907479 [Tubulanus polymorphus]|uniref:uncharacterized protein LOC141907479 n=1 Tax=Tubulanus polymorphus TaxID=672921 RepID=UPI003DA465F2
MEKKFVDSGRAGRVGRRCKSRDKAAPIAAETRSDDKLFKTEPNPTDIGRRVNDESANTSDALFEIKILPVPQLQQTIREVGGADYYDAIIKKEELTDAAAVLSDVSIDDDIRRLNIPVPVENMKVDVHNPDGPMVIPLDPLQPSSDAVIRSMASIARIKPASTKSLDGAAVVKLDIPCSKPVGLAPLKLSSPPVFKADANSLNYLQLSGGSCLSLSDSSPVIEGAHADVARRSSVINCDQFLVDSDELPLDLSVESKTSGKDCEIPTPVASSTGTDSQSSDAFTIPVPVVDAPIRPGSLDSPGTSGMHALKSYLAGKRTDRRSESQPVDMSPTAEERLTIPSPANLGLSIPRPAAGGIIRVSTPSVNPFVASPALSSDIPRPVLTRPDSTAVSRHTDRNSDSGNVLTTGRTGTQALKIAYARDFARKREFSQPGQSRSAELMSRLLDTRDVTDRAQETENELEGKTEAFTPILVQTNFPVVIKSEPADDECSDVSVERAPPTATPVDSAVKFEIMTSVSESTSKYGNTSRGIRSTVRTVIKPQPSGFTRDKTSKSNHNIPSKSTTTPSRVRNLRLSSAPAEAVSNSNSDGEKRIMGTAACSSRWPKRRQYSPRKPSKRIRILGRGKPEQCTRAPPISKISDLDFEGSSDDDDDGSAIPTVVNQASAASSTKLPIKLRKRKQFRMPDWLAVQVNSREIPGLKWVDRDRTILQLPWRHRSAANWINDDAVIFKRWAIHTNKYDSKNENPKKWKANFRCALNNYAVRMPNAPIGFRHYKMRLNAIHSASKRANNDDVTDDDDEDGDDEYYDAEEDCSDSELSFVGRTESPVPRPLGVAYSANKPAEPQPSMFQMLLKAVEMEATADSNRAAPTRFVEETDDYIATELPFS